MIWRFSLDNAAIGTPELAGARDGDAAILFVTGADGAQNLRWMIAARGRRKNKQSKGGGEMVSIGSLRLRDDFALGAPALLRSSAQDFGTADDFQGFAVAKRINLVDLPDRRPQIKLDNFEWNYVGVGSGEVEGRLVLDNRDAVQQAPRAAVELRNAKAPTLQESLKKTPRVRIANAHPERGATAPDSNRSAGWLRRNAARRRAIDATKLDNRGRSGGRRWRGHQTVAVPRRAAF